jgi:cysteine-rich repeat protein
MRSTYGSVAALALTVATAVSGPQPSTAVCNVIPGATQEFRGALGTANRPFAGPGDFVRLTLRRKICDTTSTGFLDLESGSVRSDDYAVTILFDPPAASPVRNAVILAEDCAALSSAVASCDTTLGPGIATCIPLGAGSNGLVVPDDDHLSFRFPDTDALHSASASDDRTFTGPAKIVVTKVTDPLPCGLATTRCASTTGVVACVDELFEMDGTCRTEPARIDSTFPSFTALPPPNSFQAMCTPAAGTPCTGTASEVRFTVDDAGNLLLPVDWSGVRVFLDGVPVPRLVRSGSGIDAFAGSPGTPVKVPGKSFLASYSPEGIRLPPIFTPVAKPAAAPTTLDLFGTVDAPRGVVRITRRSPVFEECSAGDNVGLPCTEDGDCPGASCIATTCEGGTNPGTACDADSDCLGGGECGPSLFEFRDRLDDDGDGQVGPVLVASFSANADTPVPLDGLLETPDVFAFAVNEVLTGGSLNSDTDALDLVMTLGARDDVGGGTSANLSAVARVRQPPFRFAASIAEDDVVAYLEPEPHEGNTDANSDGDVADTILRVFRSGPTVPAEITSGMDLCADAEPVFEERPLALSDGLVFFRSREAACALRTTERVSVQDDESEASAGGAATAISGATQALNADGRYALVESTSTDMAVGKTTATVDLFLRDRVAGTTSWVSRDATGGQANAAVARGHLSADASTVIFDSTASDLVAGTPADGVRRVFVHDVGAGTTSLLAIPDPGGACSPAASCMRAQSVSADGRFVVFLSRATNVMSGGPTDGLDHVYLHDNDTSTTELIDVDSDEVASDGASGSAAVSADGARVAFVSNGTNLDPADVNPFDDVFLRDRVAGTTELVSRASDGTQGIGFNTSPSISADGRVVAFLSDDNSLVPGDTNGAYDVFVRDVEAGLTERVSVSSDGFQADAASQAASLSEDGRFVGFPSDAENLLAALDTNTERDVFVHDRATGLTERVSLRNGGGETTAQSTIPVSLSADGQITSFGSSDTLLVGGDLNADPDTFVRLPSVGGDLTGDGDVRDLVLRVIDTDGVATPTPLGTAQQVAVENGSVVFLDGGGGVRFWANRQAGAAVDLDRAAADVALSTSWIAALVSEAIEGDGNGDGDTADTVVQRNPRATPGSGAWETISQAADALDAVGGVVAFLTPESAQGGGGGTILNGDGDKSDRVLQLWEGGLTNVGQAAEEFVLGSNLVAFRTREASQGAGGTDLNEDADKLDHVLQVWDLVTDQLVNTKQAVIPCHLEACDPRIPYRVSGDVVTFLTLEVDQCDQDGGAPPCTADLDADGDTDDIVVQTFNVRKALAVAAAEQDQARDVLASADRGVCTGSGDACSTDDDCTAGICLLPPGACLTDLSTFCGCDATCQLFGFGEVACPVGEICVGAPEGTCHSVGGQCRTDAQCGPGFCADVEQDVQDLLGPTNRRDKGEQVFVSKGTCTEDKSTSCTDEDDCPAGQQCSTTDGSTGVCQIVHGTCAGASDCPSAAVCRKNLLVAAAADADGDGVAEPLDNCLDVANANQLDTDEDGLGDGCDLSLCGDGVQTSGEGCDDGDRDAGDGCNALCESEGGACSNGVDSDGDGLVDLADAGCTSATDPSERRAGHVCDDGLDNDGDGKIDFGTHPANDTGCSSRGDSTETPTQTFTCGLGPELILLAPLLALHARLRRRRAWSRDGR